MKVYEIISHNQTNDIMLTEGIADIAKSVVKYLALEEAVRSFLTDLTNIKGQYQKRLAGDTGTELYKDMDENAAYEQYKVLTRETKGRLISIIALNLSTTSKIAKLFQKLIQLGIKPLGKAGVLIGGPVGWLVKIAIYFDSSKLVKAALTTFLTTEQGKKLLNSSIAHMITDGIYTIGEKALDMAESGLDAALEYAGISPDIKDAASEFVSKNMPDALSGLTTAEKPEGYVEKTKEKPSGEFIPWPVRKTVDPANPKIIKIGKVPVTDENGYQIASDRLLADIRAQVAHASKTLGYQIPDPTVGIQKDPSAQYGPDGKIGSKIASRAI